MQTQLPENRLSALLTERTERDPSFKASQLAAFCDVDQATLYRWRKRQTQIPDPQKERLAAFFGVSVPYLMGWDGPRKEAA